MDSGNNETRGLSWPTVMGSVDGTRDPGVQDKAFRGRRLRQEGGFDEAGEPYNAVRK